LAISDVLIVVVNELTMKDQKYIENLYNEMQRERRRKKLIVIHNYKEVDSETDLEHNILRYCVRAYDPLPKAHTVRLDNNTVHTIKTYISHGGEVTHYFLTKFEGTLERLVNVPTLELIRSQLAGFTIARRHLLSKIIEELEAQAQDFYQGIGTTRLCYVPNADKNFLVIKFEGTQGPPKMVAHGEFVEEYAINLRANSFASRFDQIRIGEELIYVIDAPGGTKDDFQKPVVDGESHQITMRGVRIRKYFPVKKVDGSQIILANCPWEYDRNFPSLVKSGRAQGIFVNRYPFPKDYSPVLDDMDIVEGVLVLRYKKIRRDPESNPLPVSFTAWQ